MWNLLDICENIWLFAGEVQKTFSAVSCGCNICVASKDTSDGLLQPGEHKVSSRVSPACKEAVTSYCVMTN